MDNLLDWHAIGGALDDIGRGARSRLAEALEMDRSQLAKTLRRRGAYPDARQSAVITDFLGGRAPVSESEPLKEDAGGAVRVPEYGYAAASDGDRIAVNEGRALDWVELPMGMRLRGEFFIVRALGSSMEPRIWPGERKIVQKGKPPGRNQDALIEFHDGSGVLKTYQGERDGFVFAMQYNPEKQLRFEASSIKAIHALFAL